MDGFFESLPGFGIGITVASFQHSGISPEGHISLNILVSESNIKYISKLVDVNGSHLGQWLCHETFSAQHIVL